MVLAHHLYDLITEHRAKKNSIPLHLIDTPQEGSQGNDLVDFTCIPQSEGSPTHSSEGGMLESNSVVDTNTLRSMFQARDVALGKLMTATAALSVSPTERFDDKESATEKKKDEVETESLECPSCRGLIPCTFPPLRSAVAVYQSQLIGATPGPDFEPKQTNWTTDFIGCVCHDSFFASLLTPGLWIIFSFPPSVQLSLLGSTLSLKKKEFPHLLDTRL
jgi:hypothetical protein